MNLITVAIGPVEFGSEWRAPSWFVRGWSGWAFCAGKRIHPLYRRELYITLLGFTFSIAV